MEIPTKEQVLKLQHMLIDVFEYGADTEITGPTICKAILVAIRNQNEIFSESSTETDNL